ncbi:class I SAM-dependent DNA methyltransferase [Rhizobium rosettiformans]|uniref:site-specific DNA-methyltransferase (adenine-specific) n=1 Tax=Rhizobium rosettiformans W3 TaxID=538378 RepID=A0A4V4HPA4_9HYPH|nr:class I SAM-dependent DNA methyltransferase [Rhizobium rosettiformans W3]
MRRWQDQEGGQERANYGLFLVELCDLLEVPHPDPASATTENNGYVFERVVREVTRDGSSSLKRIDLYKKDCFVLEAKQSRLSGEKQVSGGLQSSGIESTPRGRRASANRSWDVLMMNARAQAENYVRLLPTSDEPPPFVLVCDVGHAIEVYANFRRDGKAYDQFPDRRSFRIYLEELRDETVRARLKAIWTDPLSLDPTRHAAKVTREIATRIAKVSKALEEQGHPTEEVAMFLMRTLFTMFAEDVELLPKDSFKDLLADCTEKPEIFPGMMQDLWKAMDEGGFTATIREKVKRFNGEFFKNRRAMPLAREEIGELAAAARYDWKDVEPAIFGTFLEQALDPYDRRKLGAHYTPRAYVERLVIATVIDPLRSEWDAARSTADRQKAEGKADAAIRTVQAFHDRLCDTKVLDPACGTGNFLYVSLELMKKLEGEVLEALANLGGQEGLALESHTVDPHQFLGLEVNPRAAAIAELVLWIGHLQWHFKNRGAAPSEPILKAFHNIENRDAVLLWDGYPLPQVKDGVDTYPNARRPKWPDADYIVGNPPFVGGKDIRARMGSAYAEALWKAHSHMNDSADFVMYWWDRSADILLKPKSRLKRFGYVTTNSISQVFQRRVMEPYLNAKKPLSLTMAIADHPWTKVTRDSAAVRIAMTVAQAGKHDGRLMEVTAEEGVETDSPVILFEEKIGRINADLTVGVDLASVIPMRSNEGLSSRGMSLHGSGFIVKPEDAEHLGLGRSPGLERHIRLYRNGRDLTDRPRGVMVIDLFGLTAEDVRVRYPAVYQHVLTTVKPERDVNNRATYRDNWWIFGEPRRDLRPALVELPRYIATVETAKHRIFQFLDASILPDNKLVAIGLSDGYWLGVLSSRFHVPWAMRTGGWLGVGNDSVYVKSRCFDPFPFPDASDTQKSAIGAVAEELDAHRKRVLSEHPHLTLTGLYNVLERLKAGAKPDDLDAKERRIFDDGLVLILKELHDKLDLAVAEAYGWPVDLAEEEVLARLVVLNKERAKEEKRGLVRWLRPDYQIPRFGSDKEKAEQLEADLGEAILEAVSGQKPAFPADERDQTPAVLHQLIAAEGGVDALTIALSFRQGRKCLPAVNAVLSSLVRMGLVSTREGKSFSWRSVA